MESQPQIPEFRNNPEKFQQIPLINADTDISSKVRGLNFGLSLHLHPYFLNASSKGSGKSVYAQTHLSLGCSRI